MNNNIQRCILYHGSEFRIEHPTFGLGKVHNDFGLGFYCTLEEKMAMEWAVNERHDGFANAYSFEADGLQVLDLTRRPYTTLHWLSMLLENRVFDLRGDLLVSAREYLLRNFKVDDTAADVIVGFRADDNYFSFARAFLEGALSYERLCRVLKLGELGLQVVIRSRRAFDRLQFRGAACATRAEFLKVRLDREQGAREDYARLSKGGFDPSALYMVNIMQQGVKADDPRL